MLTILRLFLFTPALILLSCSGTEQMSKNERENNEEEIYVFDEFDPGSDFDYDGTTSSIPVTKSQFYVVQIGAFTTMEKAEEFAESSKNKLTNKTNISYNEEINLFVVQISSEFTDKKEAEMLRNELWKTKDFKDAWVQTVFR